MIEDFGWRGDHVGKLVALRGAVLTLMSGAGKMRKRVDDATFALLPYHERDFPESLRPAFNRIVGVRLICRRDFGHGQIYFDFDALTPTMRKQLVADLTALYEACLIDIGRSWSKRDFLYPRGELLPKPVRQRPKKA